MNRIIAKTNNNGKIEIVTLTSGDPKRALTNYIFQFQNSGGLKKDDIYRKIIKNKNNYYYNEYFITRGAK